jgi:hypothetical protein
MELNVVLLKAYDEGAPVEVHAADCPDVREAVSRHDGVIVLDGIALDDLALLLESAAKDGWVHRFYRCLPLDVALRCAPLKGRPS